MLPDRSVRMILIGKGLRSFADGYVAVLLPAYLLALGFNQFEVHRSRWVAKFAGALRPVGRPKRE